MLVIAQVEALKSEVAAMGAKEVAPLHAAATTLQRRWRSAKERVMITEYMRSM